MPEDTCPVQWTGRRAVVTLPRDIDGSNAGQIRERLLWIINRGAGVLVADLAGTVSCDYSGADALARVRRRSMERWHGWPRDFWDPFGEFTQLWNRMGQLFESAGEGGPEAWMPMVETEETDDAYLVRAELPGMKRDDVQVELRGNGLRITGEVTEKEEGEGKPLRQRQGRFAYRTTVPADADAEKVDAQLADGILTVRLPKAPQAQARQIEIKG